MILCSISVHPNIEEKINHYVTPAIQSCGAEAASFKDNICLQLPTQSGCVLTQTFSNEDRTVSAFTWSS